MPEQERMTQKAADMRRDYLRQWRQDNGSRRDNQEPAAGDMEQRTADITRREYQRQWRQQHRDRIREYNRQYWERRAAADAGTEA